MQINLSFIIRFVTALSVFVIAEAAKNLSQLVPVRLSQSLPFSLTKKKKTNSTSINSQYGHIHFRCSCLSESPAKSLMFIVG